MSDWEPAEQVAKNPEGKFVALIGGAWTPVEQAAKDDAGKYMVFRGISDLKAAGVTKSSPAKYTPSGETQPSNVELTAGHPITRFALGAASPFLGLAQLADNAVGGKTMNSQLKTLEDLKQGGRKAYGSEGVDWTELAGTVLNPASRVLPSGGTSLADRAVKMAGGGAAAGASMPVTNGGENFWEDKGVQASTGAVIGGATPPVAAVLAKAGKTAYHGLVEPLYEGGRTAIKGRAYLEAAGNKADEIVDLLTKNKQLTPGSAPIAGEAAVPAGRAEFSSLQQSAAGVKPSEYLARGDSQNAARLEAISDFAGNPAKRAEAVAAREARTAPHYEEGMQQQAATTGLGTLMERPSSNAVMTRAERLMQEKDKEFAPLFPNGLPRQMSGEEAQALKLSFDDMIKLAPKGGMDSAELRAIKETRGEFVKWMEGSFPDLGTGRKLYKMTSQPINEMDVGAALEEKLTPALREDKTLRSGAFSSAVRDSASTIKKATGEPRFTELEDVLARRNLDKVHGVQEDLARSDRHLEMARSGANAGPDAIRLATGNLEREVGGKMPNLLNRHAMILNAIIGRLEGKVNKRLAGEMATEMLNPPKVAEALGGAQAREIRNKMLAEEILKAQRAGIYGGSAAAARQGD